MIISIFGFENDVVGLFYQLSSASRSSLSTVHCQNNDKAQYDDGNNANYNVDDLKKKIAGTWLEPRDDDTLHCTHSHSNNCRMNININVIYNGNSDHIICSFTYKWVVTHKAIYIITRNQSLHVFNKPWLGLS